MNSIYFCMTSNVSGARVFHTRDQVEAFAAEKSAHLADLLVILKNSDADDGFIVGAVELAVELAYQVQQATGVLRDGPEKWQDSDWLAPMPGQAIDSTAQPKLPSRSHLKAPAVPA